MDYQYEKIEWSCKSNIQLELMRVVMVTNSSRELLRQVYAYKVILFITCTYLEGAGLIIKMTEN